MAAIRRTALALVFCWVAPSLAFTSREVSLGSGGVTLKGTLTLPDGNARVPGVLILAGSGPTDRNGNSHLPGGVLRNDSLKMLADGLAERGIASLRVDKRGIAASAVPSLDEAKLRFTTFVEDAEAWAALLAKEPRVSRVLLIGHSEGALVATMAAHALTASGLILIAGAGEPAGQLMRRQFAAGAIPPVLRADADRVLSRLEAGKAVSDAPSALASLFRPSVQP
ncbi:alpha/beta hydrolase [Polymorphobacter multimanifer]|uniref:Pimeloyl-ACP methyl ester carboxylesterase n=1 Tax=Polymorphobacter multimanifer TaxID=1070431 RepID=A0A841LAF7_9SPHN|nr:alpha/beta fold hydrolase [Polymorphobacter multimanifer]MBB6229420.1 pimeloyl-ACP methyl ester carboxylesterase [Polymorphobacter multimanifer]